MENSNQISTKNKEVFEIFKSYESTLLDFGRTINSSTPLIEDCLQDLFLQFCENSKLIIAANNKEAYLKTSLRRLIIRKIGAQNKVNTLDDKLFEISTPSYEEVLINKQNSLQTSLLLKSAFQSLTQSQRTIMTMRFYRSMSYEEISQKLNITTRTVYNQVHDAVKRMRVAMAK